nr:DUF4004 family protein [Clostridia bacterium]
MDENLISKKELLKKYGISYGALYRWKRMGLIPEDWFIKQATPTGQETFLPKTQICPRIELILERGGDISLSDLADELDGRSKKEAVLTVKTTYGTKVFKLSDILTVTTDDGEVRDITHLIKQKTEE